MFQNNEGVVDEQDYSTDKINKLRMFANVFELRNIAVYVIAFMVSMVGFGVELSPFAISVFAACFANAIPLLGVVIVSLIGTCISFGVSGLLSYMLTALVMIATFFIFKPNYNEDEKNEKVKVSKNVFIATIIVQIAKVMITGFTIYDLLVSITFSIVAVVFYKIFVNSLVLLQDFTEKRAFSIEEVIGSSLLLAIAVSCLGNLSVFGFCIRNILSILIVMFLGWKNGILVGTTAGVTIGVTIGIIAQTEPIMIAAYAISGMIAGILNKFGRIGVIVGFALGNVVLAYVSNGYTIELIHFKEILIASIGLLAIPKNVHIDIEDFMQNGSGFLPEFNNRGLNRSKDAAEKLNNVSETIQEMAKTYKSTPIKNSQSSKENNKKIFIAELLDCLEPYKENMLYDEMQNVEGNIVNDIFEFVMDKQVIGKTALLSIFAKNKSFVIDPNDEKISTKLNEDINQMVRCINVAFKLSKTNYVWMKKIEETKQNMESQLNSVSKAISGIAQDIKEDIKKEITYETEKKEISDKLKLKGIDIEEIAITKKGRYIVEIYLSRVQDEIDNSVVEKIISDILKERIVINEDACIGNKLSLISDDKYIMAIGIATKNKENQKISGDNIINTRLRDGKYLIALSDGMGSGKEANESSRQALELLESLLLSGFDKNTSIELINTSLINKNEEIFATLDIAIVDLYAGTIEMIKSGACPTYFKNKKKIQLIKSKSLPAGMITDMKLEVYEKDIENKEMMVMCTDGILDSNVEYKNKELWVKYLLEDLETENTKKMADLVLTEAIDNSFGIPKDDMSVFVCKFRSKE
ncbi:MAG: SpoIIE family protein phosphatase [Clostridia bacterium]|nr:SpoIIE family protein phosphatase [Clostridia bacterium]MBP3800528.1 SpoIIE family protein phosphatase [Clostridia bacterium]